MKRLYILLILSLVLFPAPIENVDASAIPSSKPAAIPGAAQEPETFPKSPAIPAEGIWLNVTESKLHQELSGKVTLVYFWDYATINSIRDMKYLKKWNERYRPYGLDMIYVHAPEYEFAAEKENVDKAIARLGINHPVFLDNNFKMWEDYEVKTWPTKFLINQEGKIVRRQVGEGSYADMEKAIRSLVQEFNPGAVLPDPLDNGEKEINPFSSWHCGEMSSETYAGYDRADDWSTGIANGSDAGRDEAFQYYDEGVRTERDLFVHGSWLLDRDYLEHARDITASADYAGMLYLANETYATMGYHGEKAGARVYVLRDGYPVPEVNRGADIEVDSFGRTFVSVSENRLYYLIEGDDYDFHEVKLLPEDAGFRLYSFSFSNHCLGGFEKS